MKPFFVALAALILSSTAVLADQVDTIFSAPETARPANWVGSYLHVVLPDRSGYCFEVDNQKGGMKRLCSEDRAKFQCLETLHKMMGDKAKSTWIVYDQVLGFSMETQQAIQKYTFRVQGETELRCTL